MFVGCRHVKVPEAVALERWDRVPAYLKLYGANGQVPAGTAGPNHGPHGRQEFIKFVREGDARVGSYWD